MLYAGTTHVQNKSAIVLSEFDAGNKITLFKSRKEVRGVKYVT
jgi:hypothetical protein